MATQTATYTREDQALANAVNLAAQETPKRFGERKAFICGVLEHARVSPYVARYGADRVRRWLVKLNRLDLIALVRDSTTVYGVATFHFVVCR